LPGTGVEADEEFDKMALMLIKGAAETINGTSSGLEVVLNEGASEARFIVEGRFISRKKLLIYREWSCGNRGFLLVPRGKWSTAILRKRS